MRQGVNIMINFYKNAEYGGHRPELNRHRCSCLRHGHECGMDTKFLGKRYVDMEI